MTIWTDHTLIPIVDDAPYTGADGIQHLGQRDKSTIPDLMAVTPVDRPSTDPASYTIDGQARGGVTIAVIDGREWHIEMIGDAPTQVWHTVARPEMTLEEVKAVKVRNLTTACAAAILAGVVHHALGAAHIYPMSATDLTNLQGRVTQALVDSAGSFNLWCKDAVGDWAKRPHTSAQTIQVGLAAAAWVQANSDRLSGEDGQSGLLKAVADAQSVAEVAAITWA